MPPEAVLLEIQYFPPVSYFSVLAAFPAVYLEQHEHYLKGSYRNRCHIAAVNGIQRLSIPLRKGKNRQQPIRQVRIAYDEPWQPQHWQAIRSAYGSAPFFEYYSDFFEPFFIKKYALLWDWNFELLTLTLKLIGLKTQLLLTETWQPEPPEGILDLRGKIHPGKAGNQQSALGSQFFPHPPSDWQSGRAGSSLIPLKYPQVFEDRHGFLSNLSILDLLFCTGPKAGNILKAQKTV